VENNYCAAIFGPLLPWTASGANINLLPGGSNLWTFLSLFNKSGRLPDVKTFYYSYSYCNTANIKSTYSSSTPPLHVKNTNQPVSKGAI
jgi:hypothetical protein